MENNKRQHVDAQQIAHEENDDHEDDSNTCQICFSKWTTHGDHQLISLRCGHFFGFSCIQRTLRDQGRTGRHCPLCNQPAKDSEIRRHFAVTSISAKDVSKEEDLKAQVNQERAARVQAELSLGKAKVRIEVLEGELGRLKEQLVLQSRAPFQRSEEVSRSSSDDCIIKKSSSNSGGFVPEIRKSVESRHSIRMPVVMGKARAACWISPERGAVVSGYMENAKTYKLMSVHPEFPNRSRAPSGGPGHELPIRDISMQSSSAVCYGGTLATASLDGNVKLISVSNLNEVCEFKLQEPVWSVCFLEDDLLVAGTVKGKLVFLDHRMPRGPVTTTAIGSEPVHSLAPAQVLAGSVCAATFTRISLVSRSHHISELGGMYPRSVGDQYSSMVCGVDGTLAISVRSQTESFVEVGRIQQEREGLPVSFCPVGRFRGFHGRPSGRIGYYDPTALIVPDEVSRSCVLYPGGEQLAQSSAAYGGSWFCGSSSMAMLLTTDVVNFVHWG